MSDLLFDEKSHQYFLNGQRLESVSEILKASGLKKEGYVTDPWYLERGKAVHKATELNDLGLLNEANLDDRIRGYLQSWRSLKRKYQRNEIEIRLYDPIYRYAGTADRFNCELKTGGAEPWHLYQIAAYSKMLPYTVGFHIVYLKEDGSAPTIKMFSYQELKRASDTFLAALNVVRARREMYKEE